MRGLTTTCYNLGKIEINLFYVLFITYILLIFINLSNIAQKKTQV